MKSTLVLLLGLLAAPLQSARAEFAFENEDTIAIIGNGLADRMQHHGWTETLLQQATSDQRLRFRNLSLSGDRPNHYPRSKGFTPMEDYLAHVEADVIFAFFGYNESFEGAEKAGEFEKSLQDMVKKLKDLKPNGKTEPRFVIFGPTAFENLEDPNLPDGEAHNERLAVYTEAAKRASAAAGVTFVDLFTPTLELYKSSEAPLTLNGVHLNAEGYRRLGEVIAEALTGKKIAASEKLEPLREAVLDKNLHWHHRYRAIDGNDIWGGRSSLKFVNDQTNAEVLQHELIMLDVMTANRDPRVWAVAKGSEYKVDDSNVPAPIPVISNVGGGSKSSNAAKEGNLDYLSGEEGLSKITVKDGFEVNLFADEKRFPELVNPVQLQVDGKGRLWAAAWPTYPKWEPLKEMNDALLIFPDEDRDGVADKCITFAKVHSPLGFEFWNGGVLVTSQPDIIFLKDTDGDDVADFRQVYFQGIGSSDTHHAANNLIYGPDGGIYWQSGVFLQHNHEHPWGRSLETGASGMYRFDPRRYTIAFHAKNSPNSHGITFDRWGYHYATDGTSGRTYQVRPQGEGFQMHELIKKEVRPVPANATVSSANFPEDMQGDLLICNTIGFLGIKQYDLHRDGFSFEENVKDKKGKVSKVKREFKTGEVWGTPEGDLLVSSDKNFRPTDAEFGSDGALYVADWHNVIIGHMQHNIRDPNRDHRHGRIYRMVHKGSPLQEPVKIAGQPIAALLDNLKHPIDGVRHRTRVELSGRDSKEVIAATQEWIKQFDPKKKEDALPLMEALWLHQQHNVRNGKLLGQMLKSPDPHFQLAATTVQHHWFNADPTKGTQVIEEDHFETNVETGILSDTPDLTTIRIGTIPEQLRYDVKELKVKAGKKIKLTFDNTDFMPHNLVIVQPGAADEVGNQAMALGAKGFELQFIPENPKILHHTAMLDGGQSEVLEFNAPDKPGSYPFVCTFPGHSIIMRGVLKVEK